MRHGVWPFVLVALAVAALGAASARAAGKAASTTTTSATTTTATTSTDTTATGTTSAPAYAPLASSPLAAGCVGAGAAAIRKPGEPTLALGTPASELGPSAYPDDAPVVSFDGSSSTGSGCRGSSVALDSLSLFGGAVTASSVEARAGKGAATELEIDGVLVTAARGETVPVERWGLLSLGATVGRITAPLVLRLRSAHDSLPAGTVVAVAFAAAKRPAPVPAQTVAHASHHDGPGSQAAASRGKHAGRAHASRRHRKHHGAPQPLKVTPRLGVKHYVFPVDGGASYVDTYGANRSDISDGWHHGDDLFARLGTPVVAVAKGKLTLVGWNALGGWRLWLTDKRGNSFYYAHLAGYSRWILHHRRVRAGQVLGFVGHTGDAFPTPPHLHFEIHPHQLVKLGYDGAVDPTGYLHRWKTVRIPPGEIPQPARLRAPAGTPSEEAAVVWRQLLVARHLQPATKPLAAEGVPRRFPPAQIAAFAPQPTRRVAAVRLAARVASPAGTPWTLVALVLGIVALSAATSVVAVRRRRRSAGETGG